MAKQIQEMVCITCPLGCRMELEVENGELKAVQHNSCKRGIEYAKQEFYDPRRMVTATIAISRGIVKRVPVRTSAPIQTKHIDELLRAMYALNLSAPIIMETTVIKNFAGSGIDVITTRNIEKAA